MARKHGRNGALYLDAVGGAAATPFNFLRQWSADWSVDTWDATCMGDSNKQYLSGLPDFSGDMDFIFDDATAQTYTAAIDGVARKFYLYWDVAAPTKYAYGTGLFDFNITGSYDSGITGKSSIKAAGTVNRAV